MKGIIIENSLTDQNILAGVKVLRTWEDGSWKLREVEVSKEWAEELGEYLDDGPWFVHFWEAGSDEVLVVFKDRTFTIKHSDRKTWSEAVEHGRSLGIPEAQLNFPID